MLAYVCDNCGAQAAAAESGDPVVPDKDSDWVVLRMGGRTLHFCDRYCLMVWDQEGGQEYG